MQLLKWCVSSFDYSYEAHGLWQIGQRTSRIRGEYIREHACSIVMSVYKFSLDVKDKKKNEKKATKLLTDDLFMYKARLFWVSYFLANCPCSPRNNALP